MRDYMRFFKGMWIVGLILWLGAATLTYIALGTGDFIELNPLPAQMQQTLGMDLWLLSVFVSVVVLIAIIHKGYPRLYAYGDRKGRMGNIIVYILSRSLPLSCFFAFSFDFTNDLLKLSHYFLGLI